MNPVRAGMVAEPEEYDWSSYWVNGQGKQSSLIRPHSCYQELGSTDEERQTAYRKLFRSELETVEIEAIQKAVNGNFVLGNDRFTKEISKMLGRRVVPGKPGRPRKKTADK